MKQLETLHVSAIHFLNFIDEYQGKCLIYFVIKLAR